MTEEKKIKKQKLIQFINNNGRWIILLIFSIGFWEMLENLIQNEIYVFDESIYKLVSYIISPIMTYIAKFITTIGSAYVIIPICIITFIIFYKKKFAKWIPINLVIIFASNQLLKRIVARPRPMEHTIVEESGYSFPSGHSMVSMAFYGLFVYLIYKKVKNKYIKWGLITLLTTIIILIGISRIYLGVHYASDVIAGFCLSVAYLTIFTKIISNKI